MLPELRCLLPQVPAARLEGREASGEADGLAELLFLGTRQLPQLSCNRCKEAFFPGGALLLELRKELQFSHLPLNGLEALLRRGVTFVDHLANLLDFIVLGLVPLRRGILESVQLSMELLDIRRHRRLEAVHTCLHLLLKLYLLSYDHLQLREAFLHCKPLIIKALRNLLLPLLQLLLLCVCCSRIQALHHLGHRVQSKAISRHG
mmetsp:Transcript_71038/g.125594  ORF Transcript_71038/g.125594 Transcript_71038/m.125594 type:complete len:205 (-) Transcript_71038:186-800(-)